METSTTSIDNTGCNCGSTLYWSKSTTLIAMILSNFASFTIGGLIIFFVFIYRNNLNKRATTFTSVEDIPNELHNI